MKRRLLLGFAAAFLMLGLGVGTAFYFTIYRPTREVMADLQQLSELRAMNDGLLARDGFTPPTDGLLTAEQVERFARVEASMMAELGEDYGVLENRAMSLEGLKDKDATGSEVQSRPVRTREAILAFKGLGPVLRRAKEAQIRALNREGFSLEEYRWVRESVYRALGFSRVDRYFEDYAAAEKPEDAPPAPDESPVEGPPANRELVVPFGARAKEWFPFLVFGL